jgi:hypothetical protein
MNQNVLRAKVNEEALLMEESTAGLHNETNRFPSDRILNWM